MTRKRFIHRKTNQPTNQPTYRPASNRIQYLSLDIMPRKGKQSIINYDIFKRKEMEN